MYYPPHQADAEQKAEQKAQEEAEQKAQEEAAAADERGGILSRVFR